jgi:hypothetical protein
MLFRCFQFPSVFLIVLLAAARFAYVRGEGGADDAEPFPIRRVLLPTERVPAEMERARLGVLKQMPLEDFEALVRSAGRSATAFRTEPRIIEARYRAGLENTDLVGSVAWKVHNPGPAARLLRLEPFNLALQKSPTFENRPAFAGDFDGRRPGLLLEEPGLRTVAADWSAHGETGPEGISFDLNLPAATVAVLDLYLPTDHAVVRSPDNYTVTGPLPAETAERRLWQIGFAGDAPLRLRIRRNDKPSNDAVVVTYRLSAQQQLMPDGLEAEYIFAFDVIQQEVSELICEYDPILRLVEVQSPELESWDLLPTEANAPPRVRIRLREPVRQGTVRISAVAALVDGKGPTWTSPAVRLHDAVPREETLVIQVHPGLHFSDWRPGGFRIVKTTTETDGGRTITLVGGGIEPAPTSDSGRPRARVTATGVEYQARQIAWWQVQTRKSSLTCQLNYEIVHGRLLQLPLEVPAGWHVERVEMTPAGLLRDWEVRREQGVSTLYVDLQRPLSSRSKEGGTRNRSGPRLTVRLTADGPALQWAIPDLVPRGALSREGSLAIDYDEQTYRARVEANADPRDAIEDGPWGNQTPDLYYSYSGEPVRGTLYLEPRQPRAAVRISSDVLTTSGRARLIAHVQIQPRVGNPDAVELSVSAAAPGKWEWKTVQGNNSVRAFEPVFKMESIAPALLGAGSPIAQALCLSAVLSETSGPLHRRLLFDRPIREAVGLEASCEIPRGPDGRWEVPLLSVPGPHESENDVTLFLPGADLVRIETDGLREASGTTAGLRDKTGSPWRTFQYGASPARLVLHGHPSESDPAELTLVGPSALTTYVERSGRQLHHFRFQLGNWRERVLPLYLPAGSEVLAARVAGRPIARIPPAASVNGRVLVELPAFTAGAERTTGELGWRTYEIVYAISSPAWNVWSEAPYLAPILPAPAPVFHRTWRLPPGVVPLHEERYRCLPNAGRDQSTQDRGLPFPLDGWSFSRYWVLNAEWESEQRRRMTEAGTALAESADGRVTIFGELLERLTSADLAGDPLVVDTAALREAGITPRTPPLPGVDRHVLPWEAFRLVYVPCRAAPVLTTRRESEIWRAAARQAHRPENAILSASLEDAVGQAATHGHDSSDRFQTAAEWLRLETLAPHEAIADSLQTILGELHADYFTEWEPLAGTDPEGSLIVVRQDVLPGIALALAAALCLAFWRMPQRGRLAMLLAWLAAAGLGYFWLPPALRVLAWWPLLSGGAAALGWYLASAVGKAQPEPLIAARLTLPPSVIGVLFVVGVGSWFSPGSISRAEEPAEPVVFLVRESNADKYTVLVPPELLDRLRLQARRADISAAGAVLVGADYQGKAVGDSVEFKADFQVYCFGDGPSLLHLPLDGVQLDGETLVDGARAYPGAAKPPLIGYTLRIEKAAASVHRVSLSFRTRINPAGEQREAALTLPSVLGSRLTLDLPPESREPEAIAGDVSVRGRHRISRSPGGVRLEADLGRMTVPLRLRWSAAAGPARPAQVEAREWYTWDIRPTAATLTALVNYKVSHGTTSTLALGIAERLEVLSVKVGATAGRSGVRLKSWHVVGSGPGRQLEMGFQNPVSGEVPVIVLAAPRGPLSPADPLPILLPKTAKLGEGYLAVHLTDLDARIQAQGLTVHDREQFAIPWRREVLADPRPWLPTHAYSFDRAATGPPSLKLNLGFAPPRVEGNQQITWRVGGDEAEFEAVAQLTAPASDLTLVEWDVPEQLTVVRISGTELSSWSRTGSRVQAWLDGRRRNATLLMAGRMKRPGLKPGGSSEFQLPCLQLLSAAAVENWIRLKGAGGCTLEEMERGDLAPLPDLRPLTPDPFYYSSHLRYNAAFLVQQSQGGVEARAFTLAELRGRQLMFTALVDLQVHRPETRSVTVELHGWPDNAPQCEVLEGAVRARKLKGTKVPVWSLELPAGSAGRYRVTFSGSAPLEQLGAGISMPDVQVHGAIRVERRLGVVAAGGLRADAERGLVAAAEMPGPWADPLRRNATFIRSIAADDWGLTLRPAQTALAAPGVQLVLAEQECCIADSRTWRFETTFWVYHDAGADLTVLLPSGASLLGIAVDDAAMTPLQPAPGRVWVPLPGSTGGRRLRVRWRFDDNANVEHPRLQMPQLEGVEAGQMLWTIHVPARYQVTPANDKQNRAPAASPIGVTGMDSHRAAAQQRLSAALAERLQSGDTSVLGMLAGAQLRFYQACLYAEQNLALGVGGSDTSPEGQPLSDQLKSLRERNIQLARKGGFESLRVEAENQAMHPRFGTDGNGISPNRQSALTDAAGGFNRPDAWTYDFMTRQGTPIYRQGTAGMLAPRLTLLAEHAHDVRKAMGLSAVWLILLAAVGLAAQLPGLRSWLRLFWPEQVVLLACLVWQTFGLNLLLVFLILLGICGRLVTLLQSLARLIRRNPPAASPTPSA